MEYSDLEKLESQEVHVPMSITIGDVVYALNQLEYKDSIEFIKAIDMRIASWEVTKALFKYFAEQMILIEFEEDEDFEIEKETRELISRLYNRINKNP